jgi:serine O-acetyltransferase
VFRTIRCDLRRWCAPGSRYQDAVVSRRIILAALLTEQGAWAVVEYRFRRWVKGRPVVLRMPLRVIALVTHKFVEAVGGISIASGAEIGPGLYIGHLSCIIVGPNVRMGENCSLSQGVTIGEHNGSPVIGNCVYFAPGCKVFGAISIGDHVAIGANAVVSESVPSRSTVVAGRPTLLEGRGNLVAPGHAV